MHVGGYFTVYGIVGTRIVYPVLFRSWITGYCIVKNGLAGESGRGLGRVPTYLV